jgi:carbon monoxide dehydrogenase subunit G
MPVITRDVTILAADPDEVFAWLVDPGHHQGLLDGAFESVERVADGVFELQLRSTRALSHRLVYEFVRGDREHDGRRVHVRTLGRRVGGDLRFSVRASRSSPGSLVTLHLDYAPGRALGLIVDRLMLREALEGALDAMLQNLARSVGSE